MTSSTIGHDSPLDNYLDALLTPAPAVEADWDSLLSEAVEPFNKTKTESQSLHLPVSTLESGREPVTTEQISALNHGDRFTTLLMSLRLVRQLPESRLRRYMLLSCQDMLALNNTETAAWNATGIGRMRETIPHE